MGRMRETLETIQRYLGSLSLTVKLLLAALCVVVVLSLALVAQYANKQSMSELLPGIVGEDQARAKTLLEKMDFPHTAQGGRVMVPTEKREQAIALLAQNGQMPADGVTLFANLPSKTTWMDSKSKQDMWLTRAVEGELAKVLSNFRGVSAAKVMISSPEQVGIGQSYKRPTAMVTIFMKGNKAIERDLVDAAAAMVAGAQAGMSPSDVKVIDGGNNRQYTARGADDFRAGDYMEHKVKVEENVQTKVADFLRYIPNVIVGVNASVDVRRLASKEIRALKVGDGTVKVPRREMNKNRRDESGPGIGGAPGFGANAGADIERARSASGVSVNTDEETTSEFMVLPGSKEETVADPRGMPTSIAVAVTVPREYVEMIAQRKKAGAAGGGAAGAGGANAAEPTEAELQTAFDGEKARLEKDLAGLVRTAAADAAGKADAGGATTSSVSVSMIPVPMTGAGFAGSAQAGVGGGGGTESGGTMNMVLGSGMVKNLVLGVLAVGAIGAMLMLVRKAGKPMELPTADSVVGLPPALGVGDADLVGEADESETAMEGIELKDDDIKSKKLIEQVAEMVKKNPADAATLMNRWVQVET